MKLVVCGALLFLAGCATTAPQTRDLLHTPPNIASSAEVKNVPFVDQPEGHCGPATLTMAMNWAGHAVKLDRISPQVMTAEHSGSLQQDMISTSRREGMMAVRVDGMESLVKEIASGHPVIILENLGLNWYTQWHYTLVTGYDFNTEELIMHSGHDASERVDMRIFERSWKLSDYWGLVVLQPGELATTAGELANMQAAAGLELAGKNEEAGRTYKRILLKWPQSLGALIGLGNLAYKEKDFSSAVKYLKQAKSVHPESSAVLHNLKVAETAAQQN